MCCGPTERKSDFLRVQAIMKFQNLSIFSIFPGASTGPRVFYFMIKYNIMVKSMY